MAMAFFSFSLFLPPSLMIHLRVFDKVSMEGHEQFGRLVAENHMFMCLDEMKTWNYNM